MLMVGGYPEDHAENMRVCSNIVDALALASVPVSDARVLDMATADDAVKMIYWADVIVMAGGDVIAQNRFIKEIELKELMNYFGGIVLAMSSGSVNCSENAYFLPEKPGEAADTTRERFGKGLGLIDISIVPHLQYELAHDVDGLNAVYDIAVPDSIGRRIHMLYDGSYFIIDGKQMRFYGKGLVADNGTIRDISNAIDNCIWDGIMMDGFEGVFTIDADKRMTQFFKGTLFRSASEGGLESSNYEIFVRSFADFFIIDDERDDFLKEMKWNVVT
jgi:dipeptidase E